MTAELVKGWKLFKECTVRRGMKKRINHVNTGDRDDNMIDRYVNRVRETVR